MNFLEVTFKITNIQEWSNVAWYCWSLVGQTWHVDNGLEWIRCLTIDIEFCFIKNIFDCDYEIYTERK